MKNIHKLTKVLVKIVEVFHWVATGLLIFATICSFAAPQWMRYCLELPSPEDAVVNAYGFEVNAIDASGTLHMPSFRLFLIGAILIFSLMAMVFRNLYLILKKSENSTPFQKDNIRMLREIGIFFLSIPVVGLLMSILIRLFAGVDHVETSVQYSGFIIAIILFSLVQFFAHGAELEKDVDGLL